MNEKPDGILLDVDGTLWDSTGIVAKAWTKAVRENGCANMTVTPQTLRGLFGRTMDVIAACLLPDFSKEQQNRLMEVCCVYEQQELERDPCRICYPGVEDTIRTLSRRVQLFIVSNCQSGYIELFLDKTGLWNCITDFECFGNTGKSKGENIRLLAERNALRHPVYVGDTQGDCDAADEAGVPFWYAAYGFGAASHYAEKLSCFSDLARLYGQADSRH